MPFLLLFLVLRFTRLNHSTPPQVLAILPASLKSSVVGPTRADNVCTSRNQPS